MDLTICRFDMANQNGFFLTGIIEIDYGVGGHNLVQSSCNSHCEVIDEGDRWSNWRRTFDIVVSTVDAWYNSSSRFSAPVDPPDHDECCAFVPSPDK